MAEQNNVAIGDTKVINFPTTATLMAIGMLSLLAIIVMLLFTKEVPKENVAPLNIVIGAIIGAVGTVIAFYFGDSKKSAQQQDTINTLAQKPVEAVAAVVAANTQNVAADKQLKAAEQNLETSEKGDK